jgi:hemerythrin-like metal-binding protein
MMVEALRYDSRYSVGNLRIDEDHRHIFSLFRDFHGALERNEAAICKGYVKEIVDALAQHFSREESIMAQLAIPNAQDHAARHRDLMCDAREAVEEVSDQVTPLMLARCYHRLVDAFIHEVVDNDFEIAIQCNFSAVPGEPQPEASSSRG